MTHGDPLGGRPDDSDAFVIRSGVRSGLKREFAFAIRAQAELPATLGRTRSRKTPPPSYVDDAVQKTCKKSDHGNGPLETATPPPPQIEQEVSAAGRGKSEKVTMIGTPIIIDDTDQGSTMETPIMINDHDECKAGSGFPEKPTKTINRSVTMVSDRNLVSAEASPAMSCESADAEEETKGMAGTNSAGSRMKPEKKMELKMSKKISVTKLPSNIRELLATGLLEGLSVKYVACMGKQAGLKGVIRGTSILCYCASCKGSIAVSAYNFEQHAGSTKKHPSDFICLENGKTIRDILESCKLAPLNMLEASIQNAICPVPPKRPSFCEKCKGDVASLCDSCLKSNQPRTNPSPPYGNDSSSRLSVGSDSFGSTSKNISSQKKVTFGRLTKKDLGLHKLVFMGDTLPEGTEVGYYVQGRRLLQGHIKDSGICCRCCRTVVSPSQFEAHAGQAQRRKPYNNIYTSNGVSLHELSVSLSKGRKLSASENDDLCSICADGGDLLLCDLCPRAFHIDCVGLSSIPKGDWYCRYCQNMHQREKCVEYNDNAIAAGRVSGVDPIEQIFKRCIRILETPETSIGGCVFCRRQDFCKSGFGPRTVLLCDQCEKEYHVGCLKDHNMGHLKEIPEGEWFCCSDCTRIHAALQELLIGGAVRLQDFDSDIVKRKRGEKSLSKASNIDVRWRLLSGKTDDDESKLLLSKAVSIFLESFDPIIDTTGRDLIPPMVFGRSTRDQDFGGMYCALLTVDSSVVSAGIVRVFGREVAELPLVATKRDCQGKGYFQSLFSCIERLLGSLNVKHFVLPAADEAESIWTSKFGFTRITPGKLKEYTGGAHTMVFQGTSMLHKPVPVYRVPSKGGRGR